MVSIDGELMKRVQNAKYLENTVDGSLTCKKHYKILMGEIKSSLSSLKKLKDIRLQSKLDQVDKALLESHLSYSGALCGSLSNAELVIFNVCKLEHEH